MELGFGKHRVLRAFVACDKNEEQAASLLFEQYEQNDSLFVDNKNKA